MSDYRTEVQIRKLPVSQLKKYLAQKESNEACKYCSEYDNRWCCPSGVPDAEEYMSPYEYAYLIAVQIFYSEELRSRIHTPEGVKMVRETLYDRIQLQVQLILIELEKQFPGSISISTCMLCKRCSRRDKKPCIHPDRMRYSMTAMGFKFAELLKEELDLQIYWSADSLPEYNVMISALLVNQGGES